jgi:hypothetical protein
MYQISYTLIVPKTRKWEVTIQYLYHPLRKTGSIKITGSSRKCLKDIVKENAAKITKRTIPVAIKSQVVINTRPRFTDFTSAIDIKCFKSRSHIVDQIGLVWSMSSNTFRLFMDLTDKIVTLDSKYDERGLLSIAFHPKRNSVFAFYSSPSSKTSIVSSHGTDPIKEQAAVQGYYNILSEFDKFNLDGTVDTSSEKVLLAIEKKNGGNGLYMWS